VKHTNTVSNEAKKTDARKRTDTRKNDMETSLLDLPFIWNIPYQRNPFFTGREEVLTHLYDSLQADHTAALIQPQGLSGLGGIGKTQTAIEYAYRYQQDYQTLLWARADSESILFSDFILIAQALNLPEKDESRSTTNCRSRNNVGCDLIPLGCLFSII